MNQNQCSSSQKSFLIRDLLRDLIVKNSDNDVTSDSGNEANQKNYFPSLNIMFY
jgi:hypothetical protein